MRPVEHFLSLIDRLEQAQDRDGRDEDRLVREFVSLTAPVIGAAAAEDLSAAVLGRIRAEHPRKYRKIGFIAAFLLGDFDNDSMELDDQDWEDIRETLEDVSGEMNLETLTGLMGELLARGRLG